MLQVNLRMHQVVLAQVTSRMEQALEEHQAYFYYSDMIYADL
jgi:hypothetical protein